MAVDPRHLKPTELVRLLNSTPLGEVAKPGEVYAQRQRAGSRLGTDNTIDLVRYAAWLYEFPPAAPAPLNIDAERYERKKKRETERAAEQSRTGREIGVLPEVVNPERKAAGSESLRVFCERYFPQRFFLAWSPAHLKAIEKIERAARGGGKFALAMPRGSGKTSLALVACLWAVLYGISRYVLLVSVDADAAESLLKNLKTELESNALLFEDFPEVCFPIRRLEGIHQRRLLYSGERIYYDVTAQRMILPTMPNSMGSDAVVETAGITASLRGKNYTRRDGQTVRPELVLLDDPQKDSIASSPSQIRATLRLIKGAVLGLAGPGRAISAVATVTVIYEDDVADQLLNREKNPDWQGERTQMVETFPDNETLWEEYSRIRRQSLLNEGNGHEATEFYRGHQAAMDAGAVVSWPERFDDGEISGLQHAMNLKLDDDESFWSEYQNAPKASHIDEVTDLKPDQVTVKAALNLTRGRLPLSTQHVTAFVDVQKYTLFWVILATGEGFTSHIVDYGCFPDQKRPYFTYREVKHTLAMEFPGGEEATIRGGLTALTNELMGRRFVREDGTEMQIERALIDSGDWTDVVYEFCRSSDHAARLYPSKGRYFGAAQAPFDSLPKRKGERIGTHWILAPAKHYRGLQLAHIDVNYWKTFIMRRWLTPIGDKGALTLFGRPDDHRMFADHITAEFATQTQGRGRTLHEWKCRIGRDNHWLDGLVGSMAAASMLGTSIVERRMPQRAKRVRRKNSTVTYLNI